MKAEGAANRIQADRPLDGSGAWQYSQYSYLNTEETIVYMETEIRKIMMALVGHIKNSIESGDTEKISSLLGNIPIWIFDRPGTGADMLERFVKLTSHSSEMEFLVLNVMAFEKNGIRASLSAETLLIWNNEKTWEEEEFFALMHLGIVKQDSTWIPEYLGFTPKQSDRELAAVAGGSAIGNPFTETDDDLLATATYFGIPSASPYMALPVRSIGADFKPPQLQPIPDDHEPSDMIPVYVPKSVLIELMNHMAIPQSLKSAP